MKLHFPFIGKHAPALKDLFAQRGIRFGMAGEYYQFESSVSLPIVTRHAATFTSEVSMKMEYTQPVSGMWNFTYADKLVQYCQYYGIAVHGHCGVWHMQNPDWLPAALVWAMRKSVIICCPGM